MSKRDPKTVMDDLMREHGLSEETRLYRATLPEFLSPTDLPGGFQISANEAPSEAVVDVYGGGHTCLAETVGAGLAFVEAADNEWRAEDRTPVSVRLGDVLAQGGRLYPVESVITERTWYVTMPGGSVGVRRED
ncbi:MAG: hypothetical protein ACYTHK_18195 [Planctomycetota bacterium]|jgi:hypothetical protein